MRLTRKLSALAITCALLTACGSGSSDEDGRDDSSAPATSTRSRVVATAPDGETVEFSDFTVSCRSSDDEQPPARIVSAVSGSGESKQPGTPTTPAMIIEAADSVDGTTVELPYVEEYGSEETFISVFITKTGEEREIASSTELSSGEIEVIEASCEPAPRLEVRIDGVMEGELSDATVSVEGYVAAG